MNNYQYQIPVAEKIIEMSLSKRYQAVVLAAAPNAGKSTIIIHALNLFFKQFPLAKVVISTHNQNILKDQMLDGFEGGFVQPEFTFGEFGSDSQVEVGIPSSRSKIQKIDLLVVDEAHHYYFANMVQGIRQKFKPEYEILMTGTPGVFNNKQGYGMYYISGEELVKYGVYSKVVIDVAIKGKDVIESYENAIKKLKQDSRAKDSKIMIACKNVDDAYVLGIYLKSKGRKIAISTSESDSNNQQIKRFKNNEADTLLVVNKGILGFSDNSITALIDLKSSKERDVRFQFLARAFRKHPEGYDKFYISTASTKEMNQEIQILKDTAALMNRETFMRYA